MRDLLGMVGVAAAFAGLMLAVRWWGARFGVHPEVKRKAMHVGMGLCMLPLPWIFTSVAPVAVLAGGAIAALLAIRYQGRLRERFGGVLGDIDRSSLGEIYFPLAVLLLFAVGRQDPLLFTIPIAILAFADATAALIGLRYGTLPYSTAEGTKSIEGSIAFAVVTFFVVLVPLTLFSDVPKVETLLLSLTLALLVMMLESLAWAGLDNLLIPVGAFALLQLYADLDAVQLAVRWGVGVAMLVFALAWRGRSVLDDAALVACALVGYGTSMIGGWTWILAPTALFVSIHLVWPRLGTRRPLNARGVIAVTTGALAWLFVESTASVTGAIVPFTCALAATLAVFGASRPSTRERVESIARRLLPMTVGAWAIVCVVPIVLEHVFDPRLRADDAEPLLLDLAVSAGAVVVTAILFARTVGLVYARGGSVEARDAIYAGLGVFASLLACLRWLA